MTESPKTKVKNVAPQRLELSNADVVLHKNWLPASISAQYLRELEETLQWSQPIIQLFGKDVLSPRLAAWYGDTGAHYRYSGLDNEPMPWTPLLAQLNERISAFCDHSFNSVLANHYQNGQDSMGWHCDDEPELGPQPVIASLSLGATRTFLLKPKRGKHRATSIALASGDLLIMKGSTQEYWRHAAPKTQKSVGARINLTFREIVKPD